MNDSNLLLDILTWVDYIAIFLCGVGATFIILERVVYFKNVKKNDEILDLKLESAIRNQDFDDAVTFCTAANTPVSNTIRKAIEVRNMDESDMREIVQSEMNNQIPSLEHSLTLLGTIASISTLLGLFGTVIGNIQAFGVMGGEAGMDPAALAGSISTALLTTAAGLLVAIPSMIFNNSFNRRVDKESAKLESMVTEFILKIKGRLH